MTIKDIVTHARERFWLLARYGIVGAFGAFVQTFSLYVWISILGYSATYLLGAFVSFCLALVISFILQKFWTFRDRSIHQAHHQAFWYGAIAVLNAIINITLLALAKELFMLLGVNFFAGWYLVAEVVIVCFASAVSFILNYTVTFRNTAERQGRVNGVDESRGG